MSDSTANAAGVPPGARYACTRGLLVTTSNPSAHMLSTLYGARPTKMPRLTGEPGKAPASYRMLADTAVSLPSRVAPALTVITVGEPGPVARSTSSRESTSLTGRPVFCASTMTVGSNKARDLPPKPPPHSIGTTLTRLAGKPSNATNWLRTVNTPWVEVHTVTFPSGSTRAEQACGSM